MVTSSGRMESLVFVPQSGGNMSFGISPFNTSVSLPFPNFNMYKRSLMTPFPTFSFGGGCIPTCIPSLGSGSITCFGIPLGNIPFPNMGGMFVGDFPQNNGFPMNLAFPTSGGNILGSSFMSGNMMNTRMMGQVNSNWNHVSLSRILYEIFPNATRVETDPTKPKPRPHINGVIGSM
jgi:hypothetical protein